MCTAFKEVGSPDGQRCWIPAGMCVVGTGLPQGRYQPKEGAVSRTLNEELGSYFVSSPPLHVSRPQSAGAQLVRYGSSERKIPLFDILANVPAARVIFLF